MRRVRIAFLAGDGGDVDDAAIVLFDHDRHDRLAAYEGAIEIDAQHLAPFVEVGFPHRLVDAGNAGIVDENINPAESFQRFVAGFFHRGEVGNIDLEGADAGADFLRGPLGEWLVVIPDRDLGAGGDKAFGDRAPKTLRAAGDDSAAAVQIDLVHEKKILSILDLVVRSALACLEPRGATRPLPSRRGKTPLLRMRFSLQRPDAVDTQRNAGRK